MGQRFLLLFKYEFFETFKSSQSKKKVIILQLFLEFEFAAQFVFETQIQIYSATQILNEINFGESKLEAVIFDKVREAFQDWNTPKSIPGAPKTVYLVVF